jgi:hypothetical protein
MAYRRHGRREVKDVQVVDTAIPVLGLQDVCSIVHDAHAQQTAVRFVERDREHLARRIRIRRLQHCQPRRQSAIVLFEASMLPRLGDVDAFAMHGDAGGSSVRDVEAAQPGRLRDADVDDPHAVIVGDGCPAVSDGDVVRRGRQGQGSQLAEIHRVRDVDHVQNCRWGLSGSGCRPGGVFA